MSNSRRVIHTHTHILRPICTARNEFYPTMAFQTQRAGGSHYELKMTDKEMAHLDRILLEGNQDGSSSAAARS